MVGRRSLLRVFAAAGVTAIAGHTLLEYSPWLDYDGRAERLRRPFAGREPVPGVPARMRELVRHATLAASGHNTQPWQFAIRDNAIEIRPDFTRHLAAVDPNDRELWIRLGCALETLCIAARADGFHAEVHYPDVSAVIRVLLTEDRAHDGPLFDAIQARQNTRSAYDGRPVPRADLDQLQAMDLGPGVALRFVTARPELEQLLDYVNQGNVSQYADAAFRTELIQ